MAFDSILAKVKLQHIGCAMIFYTLHFWYANYVYLNINHNDGGFGTLSINGTTSQQSQQNTTDTGANYINDTGVNTLGFIYVPWPQNKLSTLIVQNSDYKIIDLATNIEGMDGIDWPVHLEGNNTDYIKRIFNEYLHNASRRTDKLFCIVQNPYLRVIAAFDTTSKKKCHPTVLNRDIEKWSKYKVWNKEFDFNSLPQYLYINISICDDILYYDTNSGNMHNMNLINKYKPKFKIKCSINDLNYANLHSVNKMYDKDFELFNYSKIIYPTATNNKIWDKLKAFDTLYSVPKFDYKPLKVENISNICKTNPISAKRPIASETSHRRRTVAQNIESNKKNKKNVKIGLCAGVRNELPYLFEWIEYYRTLQQFDKIYIYNHLSQDRVAYLSYFYSEYMWNYTQVEILVAPPKGNESWHNKDGRRGFRQNCRQRALNDDIRWLAVFDVDEFMYSLNFDTIKQFIQYIDANEPHINTINVPVTPFGAKISMKKFKYDLNVNQSDKDCVLNSSQILSLSSSLSLDLLNECDIDIINANEKGIVTVIGTYLFRAPGVNAGDSQKYVTHLLQDNITNCHQIGWRGREPMGGKSTICSYGTGGKSISKIPECESIGTHRCLSWQSSVNESQFEDIAFLKGNHYFLRGYENLFASYSSDKPDKKIVLLDADIGDYFLSMYDPVMALKYHSVLSQRLSKLLRC